MIVCKKCGFNNTDADTFCGSCGAFLEWTGEKVTPPAPEPVPQGSEPAEPESGRRGFMAAVQSLTSIGVPKKEAIERPANIPGMPMGAPGMGPRPGAPGPLGGPPLGGPPGGPRPLGPAQPLPLPGRPPGAAPLPLPGAPLPLPGSPAGGAPVPLSQAPGAPGAPLPLPGALGSAPGPPVGPPPGSGPPMGGAPPGLSPLGGSAATTTPPQASPPPPGSLAPAEPPPGGVAPSLPAPSLPPPTLPARAPLPTVIRVTPAASPSGAPVAPAAAPAAAPGSPLSVQPGSPQPGAVQPAELRTRLPPKPAPAPPSKQLNSGDLICGQCGEGNEPVRKFCSRCGQSLATATVARTPWYRRIVPRRKPKVLAAGERPRGRGGAGVDFGAVLRIVRNVVLVLVLVGAAVYGAVPPVRSAVNSQVNSFVQNFNGTASTPVSVHASSVTASSSAVGHDGDRATDAFINTYWAAPLAQDPHPKLTVGFTPAANVSVILFISGDADNYRAEPRPKLIHIVFSNGGSQDITLADTNKQQTFTISGASGVTGMTIQVMSVYTSTSGHAVSIADIEFFGKR
jgi:hypothetical protein